MRSTADEHGAAADQPRDLDFLATKPNGDPKPTSKVQFRAFRKRRRPHNCLLLDQILFTLETGFIHLPREIFSLADYVLLFGHFGQADLSTGGYFVVGNRIVLL